MTPLQATTPLRPRLLLVCGSLRADSYNAALLRHVAARLRDAAEVALLDPREVALPLFDQDLEAEPEVVARVAALHARFERSHGLVVASPEYNGQPTAFLKNLVDWVSRLAYVDPSFANPFIERPVLLCSASTGWSGGAVGIAHARALFGYVGAVVLGDTVCVPRAGDAWTPDGFAFDADFEASIAEAAGRLLRLATPFAQARTAPGAPA